MGYKWWNLSRGGVTEKFIVVNYREWNFEELCAAGNFNLELNNHAFSLHAKLHDRIVELMDDWTSEIR